MLTLGLIAIAVPFCIVTGLFLGIWAWQRPWAEKLVVSPALDLMQTIPTFAYLIPMLLLFGNSPVSAMIATAIFATPPMVRATMLGLSRVPTEISEFCGDGRLHGAPEALARAPAFGAADADGRRQPGHHAGAQHGDHRLDDRRRRPRLRRAPGAARAEGRRGDGSGPRHRRAGHRARPAEPGGRAAAVASPWRADRGPELLDALTRT